MLMGSASRGGGRRSTDQTVVWAETGGWDMTLDGTRSGTAGRNWGTVQEGNRTPGSE